MYILLQQNDVNDTLIRDTTHDAEDVMVATSLNSKILPIMHVNTNLSVFMIGYVNLFDTYISMSRESIKCNPHIHSHRY